MVSVSAANSEFWSELCGTGMARSLGIVDLAPQSLSRFDRAYFEYYPYLLPQVERAGVNGRAVLEIGLGFGSVGGYVAQRAAAYHAIDIAANPVGLMRQRLEFLGVPSDLAQQGSALDLPFPAETFDTAISIGTLHQTGDLARGVAEAWRVLRPGGIALVMVYNRHSFRQLVNRPKLRIKEAVGRQRQPADRQLRGMYDQDSDGAVAPHTDFTSVGEARRLFGAFRKVRIERRNFDDYPLWRFRVHREWLLGSIDRLLGLDLYITAVK